MLLKLFVVEQEKYNFGLTVRVMPECSLIHQGRAELAGRFLEERIATHLFFLDSDVWFRPSLFAAMLFDMVDQNLDLLSAVYPDRRAPFRLHFMPQPGAELWPDPTRQGRTFKRCGRVVPIKSVGIGATMINRRVVTGLCELYPELRYLTYEGDPRCSIFHPLLLPFRGDTADVRSYGEDFAFFERAYNAGFRAWALLDEPLTHAGITRAFVDEFVGAPLRLGKEP